MNDMTEMPAPLVFSDSAAEKVKSLIEEEGNPELKLRVFVTGGGCSGFQYGFTFDEAVNDDDTQSIVLTYAGSPGTLTLPEGTSAAASTAGSSTDLVLGMLVASSVKVNAMTPKRIALSRWPGKPS